MEREKYTIETKELSISILQTQVESVRTKSIIQKGIRVFEDGYIGVAGGLGNVPDEILEEEAIKNLSLKIAYPHDLTSNHKWSHIQEEDLSDKEVVKQVKILLETFKTRYPNFILSNKINKVQMTRSLENTKGLDLKQALFYYSIGIIVKEKSSVNFLDAIIELQMEKWDLEKILIQAEHAIGGYINTVQLPKKKSYPIIVTGNLFLEKIIEELAGNKVGTGTSLLNEHFNKQCFNPAFTLYASFKEEDFAYAFDAEGTMPSGQEYILIDEGYVKHAYTDKYIAKRYHLPLTGAADATYDSIPELSVPEIRVRPGNQTLRQLLKGEFGILIGFAMGGDTTPAGKFATPVQLAYLTDGEKILGRLPELKISGNIFEMFGPHYIGCSCDKPFENAHAIVTEMAVEI